MTTILSPQEIQINHLQSYNQALEKNYTRVYNELMHVQQQVHSMVVPAAQAPMEPVMVFDSQAEVDELKTKLVNEMSNSAKKDERIKDMQRTIDALNAKLAETQAANDQLENRLKDGIAKYKELQASLSQHTLKASKQHQPDVTTLNVEESIYTTPLFTDMEQINHCSVGYTVNDWVHPNETYHLCVKAIKGCTDCPLLEECKTLMHTNKKGETISFDQGSKIRKACNLMAAKRSIYRPGAEFGINVDVEKGQYVTRIYDESGLYIGVVREAVENAKILKALRKRENRGKTVVVRTTPTPSMQKDSNKQSIFTSVSCEILEVVERKEFPRAPKAPVVEEVVDPQVEVAPMHNDAPEIVASANETLTEEESAATEITTVEVSMDDLPDEDDEDEISEQGKFDQYVDSLIGDEVNDHKELDPKVAAMFFGA